METARILLTDDEETFLHATAALLQQEGYECTCAADTQTAEALLNDESYDLLIADIKMPGNPDLEFVRSVPHIAEGLPVILVTGYPSLRSAIDSLELPVSAYLLKPLVFHDLLTAVERAVQRSRATQAIFSLRDHAASWHHDMESLSSNNTLQTAPQATIDTALALSLKNLTQDISDLSALIQSHPLLHSSPTQESGDTPIPKQTDQLKGVLLEIAASLQRVGVVDATHEKPQHDVIETLSNLSAREKDVLRKLFNGQRVSTIAKSLYISPNTVRNHLKSIFRKTGIHSQAELLEYLRKQSLQASS